MSDVEQRIKEAFDAISLPAEVRAATLDAIEKEAHAHRDASYRSDEEAHIENETRSRLPERNQGENVIRQPSSQRGRWAKPFTRRVGFAVAACLMLVLIGFGGYSAYAAETAVVAIEINPSIELGINRFDRVVSTRALNDEGRQLLDDTTLIGASYEEALARITESRTFIDYSGKDSFLDINVICENDDQADALMRQSSTNLDTLDMHGSCKRASSDTHHQAQAVGMGVARYEAAQALMLLDPEVSLEECEVMTMSELKSRIAKIDPDHELLDTQGRHGEGRGRGQKATSGHAGTGE